MNTKQWAWLYRELKAFIKKYQGKVPDEMTATGIMDLYCKVMGASDKERRTNPDMDTQMRTIFNTLFDMIHALEKEGKVL